jgi:radical SAM superfamily enzyme YgiQ (UPF0313 family)
MYIVINNRLETVSPRYIKKHMRYQGRFPDVITSRGCPFSCSYCVAGSLDQKLRKRSVENVIAECFELLEYNPYAVNFQDPSFLIHNINWIERFAKEWKAINIPFGFRARPEHCTKERLQVLKEAGLAVVSLGLQSGSNRVNKTIYNRNATSAEFLRAVTTLDSLNIPVLIDVIENNPWEGPGDIEQTKKILSQVPGTHAVLHYNLVFYQGTALREKAEKEGIDFPDPRDTGWHKPGEFFWYVKLFKIMARAFGWKLKIFLAFWKEGWRKARN